MTGFQRGTRSGESQSRSVLLEKQRTELTFALIAISKVMRHANAKQSLTAIIVKRSVVTRLKLIGTTIRGPHDNGLVSGVPVTI